MKRRVIQIAESTQLISLPRKWGKKYNIKKGDELEVGEVGNTIIISTKRDLDEVMKKTIDIKGLNRKVVKWILSAMHKKGYDEVEIFYDSPEQLKIIQNYVTDLMTGFAIIEQTADRCVLRCISRELESEFNATLRRAFMVTISMGDSCLDYIRKGQYEKLEELNNLEMTNNKLTNFCERIINKGMYRKVSISYFMYVITWNLEKVCDEYKYICDYLSKADKKQIAISDDTLLIFEQVNNFLKSFYESFYKFDFQRLYELDQQKKKLLVDIEKKLQKATPTEIILLQNLSNILSRVVDFFTSTCAINS